MAKTLLLDTVRWDIIKDAAGNIALASEPYSQAQDAASAIRLFRDELWYQPSKGIPYYDLILGKAPPFQLFRQQMQDAALTVPGVTAAVCYITEVEGRQVRGQVQITDASGVVSATEF
ncbi:MAG: hypothetical protein K2X46_19440 [Roseomonas sp.]|nr:hypothetical protein [Roseomonas sp.]